VLKRTVDKRTPRRLHSLKPQQRIAFSASLVCHDSISNLCLSLKIARHLRNKCDDVRADRPIQDRGVRGWRRGEDSVDHPSTHFLGR
jgi:hypothetical protein